MSHSDGDARYVQSEASLDVPPPYFFPDVSVQGIVFEANMAAVQKYCDDYLNLGPPEERGFEYRAAPFWPYAQLLFLHYPVMISATTSQYAFSAPNERPDELLGRSRETIGVPLADRGSTTQNEVFIAMPVVRCGLGPKNRVIQTELEWILPFIVVDQPWSSVCGREMLGLGKLLAQIDIAAGYYPGSFEGRVQMPGWRETDGDDFQQMVPFLDVKTGPTLPSFRTKDAYGSLATTVSAPSLRWAMEKLSAATNFIDTASLGLVPTTMRTVGLKQFRDAVRPDRAVYQALVSCRSKYSQMRNLELYDEREISVTFNAVGSFRQIVDVFLGEDRSFDNTDFPGEGSEVPQDGRSAAVVGGFRFEADVDYDRMRVLHEFAIKDDAGQVLAPATSDLTARWFRPLKGFFASGGMK